MSVLSPISRKSLTPYVPYLVFGVLFSSNNLTPIYRFLEHRNDSWNLNEKLIIPSLKYLFSWCYSRHHLYPTRVKCPFSVLSPCLKSRMKVVMVDMIVDTHLLDPVPTPYLYLNLFVFILYKDFILFHCLNIPTQTLSPSTFWFPLRYYGTNPGLFSHYPITFIPSVSFPVLHSPFYSQVKFPCYIVYPQLS